MMDKTKKLTDERGAAYGHPLDNFRRMAQVEALVSDCQDTVVRQALYMIGMKVTRLVHNPTHQDSIDDIKGYAETINMVHAERRTRYYTVKDACDALEDACDALTEEDVIDGLKAHSEAVAAQDEAVKSERDRLTEKIEVDALS